MACSLPARAQLVIGLTFHENDSFKPAGLTTAQINNVELGFRQAAGELMALYANPIEADIDVFAMSCGGSGIPSCSQKTGDITSSTGLSALQAKYQSNASWWRRQALVSLKSVLPTLPVDQFQMFGEQEKALGLTPTNADGGDIWFDPTRIDLSTPTELKSVALHEISEILGRVSKISGGDFSTLDLFRYTAPNQIDRNGLSGGAYFSIDSGNSCIGTPLNQCKTKFGPRSGDDGDFNATDDPFGSLAKCPAEESRVIQELSIVHQPPCLTHADEVVLQKLRTATGNEGGPPENRRAASSKGSGGDSQGLLSAVSRREMAKSVRQEGLKQDRRQ